MRTKGFEIDNPFAPVELVPLSLPDGQEASRNAVVIDNEGEKVEVGVVSQDYRLITNKAAQSIGLDLLTRSKLPFEEKRILFNGRRFMQRWTIKSLEFEPIEGDFVRLGIEIRNSYDGTAHFSCAFIAERVVCGNGMVLDFLLGGFRFRHYGDHTLFDQELEKIEASIVNLSKAGDMLIPTIQRMEESQIDRGAIQDFFREIKLPITYMARVFLAIESDNEWGLYNACTQILTESNSFRAEALNRTISQFFFQAQ